MLAELKQLARDRPAELRAGRATLDEGDALVDVSVATAGIVRLGGGLHLGDWEPFTLRIPETPFGAPSVEVPHLRFLGFPHVLQGRRICIYLDPSREWHPLNGIAATLDRLWQWLRDAAGGQFDASAAMYHAVGGVLHRAPGTPTIVARATLPAAAVSLGWLTPRTDERLDLTLTREEGHATPVISLGSDLPLGASSSLVQLMLLADYPRCAAGMARPLGALRTAPAISPAITTALIAAAMRNATGTAQYFVLAVPHPAGGAPHLLCGRLPALVADALRDVGRKRGTLVELDPTKLDIDIPIEWCNMSDERDSVTTRRDADRPVNGFLGKTVQLWGCGGLGSWIAEFAVRAGASQITICDPGVVTGGLLVRQNYAKEDIGRTKADALAMRLAALRDDVDVRVATGILPDDIAGALKSDLVVDATVNNAITALLDSLIAAEDRRAIIAQAATDVASGTLGILTICPSGSSEMPSAVDAAVGRVVTSDGELELYHRLWADPLSGDELTPTRGCSVPTFHGSAADLAAVAGVLTTLLGSHLSAAGTDVAGTHLVALPLAGDGPRHRFVPAAPSGQ